MLLRLRRSAAALVLLLLLQTAQAAPRARHVVIVSFDGGNPTVMRQSAMPTVIAMWREGAGTWNATTIFPSATLMSHASMLTGVEPTRHGIFWNDWWEAKGPVKVPTVFGAAKAHGLTTALFAGKPKFRHLDVPGTLDVFALPGKAAAVAEAAAAHIVEHRPALCFVHLTDTDSTGHTYGWGSAEQKRAFADEDAAVAVLRRAVEKAGIARDTVFLLTADHGGHDKTHGSADPADMTIPWIAWGAGVRRGVDLAGPVRTYDTAATALWLLGVPLPPGFQGRPVTEAFAPDRRPAPRPDWPWEP